MVPKRIIWHHSADSFNGHQSEKINAYHKTLDFPKSSLGYYVGYHYLIEQDGLILKTRNETEIGAHDKNENLDSIGICLAGNFNIGKPTTTQINSAVLLIDYILIRWKISPAKIEPHRLNDATDCPGVWLPDDWLKNQYINWKIGWLKAWLLKLGLYKF
ncbi:MAG: peptidoglycan recognition family protein [Patescibacteria group bacterium]